MAAIANAIRHDKERRIFLFIKMGFSMYDEKTKKNRAVIN
jgi:hypothetical protein